MTGTYCARCGAERAASARFCPNCGAPVAVPSAGQSAPSDPGHPQPAPTGDGYAVGQAQLPTSPAANHPTVQQSYPAQTAPQPAYPAPQSPTYPAGPPRGYAVQQPPVPPTYAGQQAPYGSPPQQYVDPQAQYPYGGQPQQPWGGNVPFAGPPVQPGGAPWSVGPVGAPQRTGAGRNAIDSLLTGDWGGAARAAVISVGAMLGVSLIGMLFLTEGGIGFHETLSLILAGACLAVGGDAYAEGEASSFGASASFSVGLLPLTVTVAGLGLLAWLFARQVRKVGPTSRTEVLLHGVRTALIFTALFLPLSLLTRYQAAGGRSLGLSGRLGVGVVSTVIGALLFAVAVLGLTALLHRSTVLPGRVGAFRDKALAPLFGAVAVFSVGLLAVLGALIYGLITADNPLAQLGVAVLGAVNGALAGVLWSAGVPMNVDGTASATPLGQFSPGGTDVTLFTFTDASAWFWLAPVMVLAAALLVATALAVRQNTIEGARREGFRFAGALAVLGFVAALLLRIGFDGGSGAGQFGDLQAAASGSLMFNPLMAAFVLAIWGVLTGLLAPVVAAKVPSGFVMSVRRRFGTAGAPPPCH